VGTEVEVAVGVAVSEKKGNMGVAFVLRTLPRKTMPEKKEST
jgi:hypothetical protein